MSRLVTFAASAVNLYFNPGSPGAWALFASQVFGADQDRIARKRRRAAERAARDGIQDRLEMVERDPNQARTLPLGRVRCVEGVRRDWQSGANSEVLSLVVSFGGCRIDAFEQFYLNDLAVTLNGSGYVQEAPYNKSAVETVAHTGTLDGSGGATVVIAHTPISGTLSAVNIVGSGDNEVSTAISASLSTLTVTISGGTAGAKYGLTYDHSTASSLVRIRPYLGTDTQTIGDDIEAEYTGGGIRDTDDFAGIAAAVMDLTFDTDVFPTGRPTLTAVLRGALCYDPRLDSTADGGSGSHRFADPDTWEWSENSAILALRYATWENGLAVPIDEIRLADFMAAADVCDEAVTFTLRKADDTTEDVELPRYRCGIVVTGENPREEMDAIVQTMAGRWCWAGGELRIRAGAKAATALAIDSTWFMQAATGGELSSASVISGANSIQRDQRINRVSGSCVDPDQRYQSLPFPAVSDDVLIAAKGLRPAEINFEGVNHIAHAQHLSSIAIREAQAGLRIDMTAGLQALGAEVIDVAEIDLARYGFTDKTCEIVGWQWAGGATVKLQLAEITDAIFEQVDELTGRDPAPDSTLRPPWDVEQMAIADVTSGTTATLDGTIMTRTVVEWDPVVGESVRQGGDVEVQYAKIGEDFPDADWPSWVEAGNSTQAVIPGLLANRAYRIRARAVQRTPLVRGKWSVSWVHIVAGRRAPTIYRQTSAPTTGVIDGDTWYDTDADNRIYIRVSGSWVATDIGTGGIASNAATKVDTDEYDFAGGTFGTTTARAFSVTPAVDCLIEFTAKITAAQVLPDSGNTLSWVANPASGSDVILGGAEANNSSKQEFTCINSFAAVGGVAIDFEIRLVRPGGNPAIALSKSYMRVTQIKR